MRCPFYLSCRKYDFRFCDEEPFLCERYEKLRAELERRLRFHLREFKADC